MEHRKVVIVGSGPAGYTAAIYAARAELEPLMFAGLQFGGQLMLTTDVENYPGFPEGVTGPEMMEMFQRQAERFGAEVVDGGRDGDRGLRATLRGQDQRARRSPPTPSSSRPVPRRGGSGLESEQRLQNQGVSACATCDGALYRGKPMAVVGGGDTAIEEALFLTRFATEVTVIHRRDELRASKIMQERAKANAKIEFAWNSVVDEILGRRVRDRRAPAGRPHGREAGDPGRGGVRRHRSRAEHGLPARSPRARRRRLHQGRGRGRRGPRWSGSSPAET